MVLALILALDDDPVILEMIELIFAASGHQIETLSTPATFLERAQSMHPDLILLDLLMPEISGWDLLKKIRLDPTLAPIPVIILSASSGVANRVKGLRAGAYDYLEKPFDAEELRLRVEGILSRGEQPVADCQGKLKVFPFSELVHSLEQTKASGTLLIINTNKHGFLFFHEGRIKDARFGRLSGSIAVEAMIGLTGGSFKYTRDRTVVSNGVTDFLPKTQTLLMNACWVEDELAKRGEALPKGEAKLVSRKEPVVDEEFNKLPLNKVFDLIKKDTCSLDGLVDLELSSPNRIRLTIALLSEMGSIAVG